MIFQEQHSMSNTFPLFYLIKSPKGKNCLHILMQNSREHDYFTFYCLSKNFTNFTLLSFAEKFIKFLFKNSAHTQAFSTKKITQDERRTNAEKKAVKHAIQRHRLTIRGESFSKNGSTETLTRRDGRLNMKKRSSSQRNVNSTRSTRRDRIVASCIF